MVSPADLMDSRMAQVLAVPTRVQLLRLLRDGAAPMSAADLAGATRLHVNTVRSHLELLVDVGLATRTIEAPTGPGRPHVVYRADGRHPGLGAAPVDLPAPADPAASYRDLAAVLVNELATRDDPAGVAVEAGRRWAGVIEEMGWPERPHDAVETVSRLVELLARLGFAPSTEPLGDRIYLHACPFVELARANPTVVCGVHLGLLRGAAERLGAPLTATAVDPFIRDDLCLVRLGPVTPVAQ